MNKKENLFKILMLIVTVNIVSTLQINHAYELGSNSMNGSPQQCY
jgi:hypothetical protein